MLTLEHDRLTIRFPEIHPDAVCHIEFQRTLRIPDDNRTHGLPPGLGRFPLAHVDDHAANLPADWQKRGGVFLPMHSTEAMWIKLESKYPFAVKIATGKINAVTGKAWAPELKGPRWVRELQPKPPRRLGDHLSDYPFGGDTAGFQSSGVAVAANAVNIGEDQDYLSVPKQRWLDGFCVEKGKIRQFVAMPMGEGYTVEEQLTGEALHGGLQIIVYPLKPEFYHPMPSGILRSGLAGSMGMAGGQSGIAYSMCASAVSMTNGPSASGASGRLESADMGMAPGGLMEQSIHTDTYGIQKFDQSVSAKCFVHLLNSQQYERVTGKKPAHSAPTAADYTKYGLPWFKEGNASGSALPGAAPLKKLDSVANLGNKLGQTPLPDNSPLPCAPKVLLVPQPNQVREGDF